jgi:capsular polysaccharide biosynthesis protein
MTTHLHPLPAPDPADPVAQSAEPRQRNHLRRDLVLAAIAAILAATLAAIAVYVASGHLPATFQSSATIRVAIQSTSDVNDGTITASNDLASQYAQIASTGTVIGLARKQLDGADAQLTGNDVVASTVAAQNLVKITVNGHDGGQSQRRADAVGTAFVEGLRELNGRQAEQYSNEVSSRLGPIDRSIALTRRELSGGTQDSRRNAAIVLASLIVQRQQVQASIAQNVAAMQPTLTQVAGAGPGEKVSPKPKLYAIVAFVIVLLVVGRVLIVAAARRPRPPEVAEPGATGPAAVPIPPTPAAT